MVAQTHKFIIMEIHILYSVSKVTGEKRVWGYYSTEAIAKQYLERDSTNFSRVYDFEYKCAHVEDSPL